LVQTGTLQRGLGVGDRSLGPDVLAMPLIDPKQRPVHQWRHALAELRPVPHQLRLRHSLLLERLRHRRLVKLRLRSRKPAKVVRVEMEHTSHNRFGRASLQEHARQLNHVKVVLANPLV
jgi:hypothetical protein